LWPRPVDTARDASKAMVRKDHVRIWTLMISADQRRPAPDMGAEPGPVQPEPGSAGCPSISAASSRKLRQIIAAWPPCSSPLTEDSATRFGGPGRPHEGRLDRRIHGRRRRTLRRTTCNPKDVPQGLLMARGGSRSYFREGAKSRRLHSQRICGTDPEDWHLLMYPLQLGHLLLHGKGRQNVFDARCAQNVARQTDLPCVR
jgi:hypothetical protein